MSTDARPHRTGSATPTVEAPTATSAAACRSPLGTYAECPLCGGPLHPEHAHFRCSGCGWRDSCCD